MITKRKVSDKKCSKVGGSACAFAAHIYCQKVGGPRHYTQASEAGGYAGDRTPATIYEGILICISPLEKYNTQPCYMHHVVARTEMVEKAI